MNTKLLAAAAALVVAAPAVAQNAPSITVVTYLEPNFFGSPSYAAWSSNAVDALKGGVPGTAGTPDTPAYAFSQTDITRADMIVTGFPSWKAQLNPGATFGPAYANELGTRAGFGVIINGNGTQFSVDQLFHSAKSNDTADYFGYGPFDGFVYGSNNPYGENLVGVLVGKDGKLFTNDDLYVTGGAASQLVDGLIGVADANGEDPCSNPGVVCNTDDERRAAIADDLNQLTVNGSRISWPTQYTGTFTLNGASGSGTFNISAGAGAGAVPEIGTWAMMIAGFGLVGAAMRRRATGTAFA